MNILPNWKILPPILKTTLYNRILFLLFLHISWRLTKPFDARDLSSGRTTSVSDEVAYHVRGWQHTVHSLMELPEGLQFEQPRETEDNHFRSKEEVEQIQRQQRYHVELK